MNSLTSRSATLSPRVRNTTRRPSQTLSLALEMASKFLASDQPVPPEVWQGLAGNTSPRSNLHKGMIMLGVGVGVFLCFWLMGAMEAAYLALIPLFIGIAQLLIWNLEKHKASPKE